MEHWNGNVEEGWKKSKDRETKKLLLKILKQREC
jgi:hypothetical protein